MRSFAKQTLTLLLVDRTAIGGCPGHDETELDRKSYRC